ncbi:hypothetical protein Tco_0110789 [Tanacetum coccineum]
MKEQAYNIIMTKDSRTQRQSNLNKSKEARFKISPQEFEDHILGEIVSLKVDTGKAVDADLVVTKSSGTESEVQDDNNRSRNDTDAEDANIRSIYDFRLLSMLLSRPVTQHYLPKRREFAFAKPDYMIASSESRNSSKIMPRFSSNDMVEPTSRIFKSVSLRWIPTGKLFDSCTSKVDSEPTHGLDVDIPNIYESKQTLDLSVGTSINVQKEQSLDLSTELESLFGHLFDEYSNGVNQLVSKSSAVTAADASDKRQQQPDSTSSTSTLATTVTADGNFDL